MLGIDAPRESLERFVDLLALDHGDLDAFSENIGSVLLAEVSVTLISFYVIAASLHRLCIMMSLGRDEGCPRHNETVVRLEEPVMDDRSSGEIKRSEPRNVPKISWNAGSIGNHLLGLDPEFRPPVLSPASFYL